jgi:hypothetical protein
MVPVAPVTTGITIVFTFHMRCISIIIIIIIIIIIEGSSQFPGTTFRLIRLRRT